MFLCENKMAIYYFSHFKHIAIPFIKLIIKNNHLENAMKKDNNAYTI
ncbi:hypothetical protein SAMN05192569_101314 [Parageobacillus thermantarcticus]|uniref:Uncharacterized protein n=2 Tax=Anoxybacillaceae TaxID=3120669 RepID=A0A1I0T4U8_9BACL|nr:hypothetical protein SAMN05192569_101314 [Parageobacillus thermantarcticus]